MIKTSKRYQLFLNNYQFYPNSVNFRIHSSKALEKFKNVQSFQLNQLANGKYHFAPDRRELLLLMYDMWSRWLYEIENLIIEVSGNHPDNLVNNKDLELIILLAVKTSDTYIDIIKNKFTNHFEEKFSSIWIECHESVFDFMISEIKKLEHKTFDMVFIKIVDLLCEIMQYSLIEIYEIDSLICINEQDCLHCSQNNICIKNKKTELEKNEIMIVVSTIILKSIIGDNNILLKKINILKKYFEFNKVILKNHTEKSFNLNLINLIENNNLIIDFKKSLLNY